MVMPQSSYTVVEWLVFKDGYGTTDGLSNINVYASNVTIRNNIFYNTAQAGLGIFAHQGNGATLCRVYNNVFYNLSTAVYDYNFSSANGYYNNTIFKCNTGVNSNNQGGAFINNLVVGNTTN
jgi:hypothetical protein